MGMFISQYKAYCIGKNAGLFPKSYSSLMYSVIFNEYHHHKLVDTDLVLYRLNCMLRYILIIGLKNSVALHKGNWSEWLESCYRSRALISHLRELNNGINLLLILSTPWYSYERGERSFCPYVMTQPIFLTTQIFFSHLCFLGLLFFTCSCFYMDLTSPTPVFHAPTSLFPASLNLFNTSFAPSLLFLF